MRLSGGTKGTLGLLPVFPAPFVSITIPKSLSLPTWRTRWHLREIGLLLSSLVLLRRPRVMQSMAVASCPLLPCKRWPCFFSVTQGDLSPDSWVRPWQPAINKFYCLQFAFVRHQSFLHCQYFDLLNCDLGLSGLGRFMKFTFFWQDMYAVVESISLQASR